MKTQFEFLKIKRENKLSKDKNLTLMKIKEPIPFLTPLLLGLSD
jgi:hypothetical protein